MDDLVQTILRQRTVIVILLACLSVSILALIWQRASMAEKDRSHAATLRTLDTTEAELRRHQKIVEQIIVKHMRRDQATHDLQLRQDVSGPKGRD